MKTDAKLPSTLVEPGTVRLERLLPGPVERVWEYLTVSKKRALWLAAGEWDLRVGGKIELHFDNSKLSGDKNPSKDHSASGVHTFTGAITRLEPMRLLSHSWNWDGNETEATYTLTPQGKDVLLVIVHKRLKPRDLVVAVMAGWDTHTGILEDNLRGVKPRPFYADHSRLEKVYAPAVPQ